MLICQPGLALHIFITEEFLSQEYVPAFCSHFLAQTTWGELPSHSGGLQAYPSQDRQKYLLSTTFNFISIFSIKIVLTLIFSTVRTIAFNYTVEHSYAGPRGHFKQPSTVCSDRL